MVVTIIGMVASIAVPRISHAAVVARANSLQLTIVNIRKAIDAYYAEHGKYPGYLPGTDTPSGPSFKSQLMMYSDAQGNTRATPGYPYIYGPYMSSPFPRNPTNNLNAVYVKPNHSVSDPADGSVGWLAVLLDGSFGISATNENLEIIGFRANLGVNIATVDLQ
jgi:type II secretory pathway pseudopilin PulG